MRRTLMLTSAPIFSSLSRMLPQLAYDLLDAITLKYPGYGNVQVKIEASAMPPMTGSEKEAFLEMRVHLIQAIGEKFDSVAEDKASDMDPPDYLKDSAHEYASQLFSELSDEDKFEYATAKGFVDDEQLTPGTLPERPHQFDPLNNTSGTDYKRTQAMARYLSIQRAVQVISKRMGKEWTQQHSGLESSVGAVDRQLWRAWKESSTSRDGKLLQLATAEELGGRLREEQLGSPKEIEGLKDYANNEFAPIGGYKGILAYTRAKWETTQYLLDQAGQNELELYRGLKVAPDLLQKLFAILRQQVLQEGGYERLPNIFVERNGAASTTTDPGVANNWSGGEGGKIVLRALMPRTAIISVPAYGINVHSEKEVVVAGTAWKGWDAFRDKAPTFNRVPLKLAA
jgi:hypothetical protein